MANCVISELCQCVCLCATLQKYGKNCESGIVRTIDTIHKYTIRIIRGSTSNTARPYRAQTVNLNAIEGRTA
jgi:hypothetical protein